MNHGEHCYADDILVCGWPDEHRSTELTSAWIAPDGKRTHLINEDELWESHCSCARNRLGDPTGGMDLEKQGYLHLTFGYPDKPYGEPTQAQLDALGDILTEIGDTDFGATSLISDYIRESASA